MSEARRSGFWTVVERIFASVAGLDKEAENAALDALCGARAGLEARGELPGSEAVAMRETPSLRSACPAGS